MKPADQDPGTPLDELVRTHDHAYHREDAPHISDAAYDALRSARANLTDAPPPSLPDPAQHLATVRHDTPMLSLTNVTEPRKLDTRLLPRRTNRHTDIVMTPKLDGLALSLVYEDGKLLHAATRGNGATGENVTANVIHIPGIPQTLPPGTMAANGRADIRGEAFIRPSAWEAYKADTVASGSSEPSNPRNAAAGAIRKKTPVPSRLRHVSFLAYDWRGNAPAVDRYSTLLKTLHARTGIETVPFKTRNCVPSHHLDPDAERYHRDLSPDLPRDGIVVQIDNLQMRKDLGTNNRAPLYAFARKWQAEAVVTVLKNIVVECGRTGRHTPVAELEPVEFDGVTITRATLHHPDYIKALDIAPGDRVTIERAGSVIPAVLGKAPDSPPRDPGATPWTFPRTCACKRNAPLDFSQVHPYCPADEQCAPMVLDRLAHAASRDALDIDGLSHTRIAQLADVFGLTDIHELFDQFWPGSEKAAKARVRSMPSWGKKSAEKLSQAISNARRQTLQRWLYALGIPHVGRTASAAIAARAPSVDAILLLADRNEDLTRIDGVNITAATNFREALQLHGTRRFAAASLAEQLTIADDLQPADPPRPLEYQQIFIAGEPEHISATQAEQHVRSLGALTVRHIELATLVLAAAKSDNQRAVANALSIPVADATEFLTAHPAPQPQQEHHAMQPNHQPLSGKKVVVTGKLEVYTRSTINDEIIRRGGTPQSSVTRATDILVVGEKPGSKLAKAQSLGVTIINEAQFEQHYG